MRLVKSHLFVTRCALSTVCSHNHTGEHYADIFAVVFGVLVVQWLTFGSYEPDLAFNQPFGLANVANSQIAYAADHSMPERINIPNQKSGMESRCAMNFITMAEDPET